MVVLPTPPLSAPIIRTMGLILLPPLCWLAVFDDGRPAARSSLPAAPRSRAISGDGAAPARRRRPPADRDFDFTLLSARGAPRRRPLSDTRRDADAQTGPKSWRHFVESEIAHGHCLGAAQSGAPLIRGPGCRVITWPPGLQRTTSLRSVLRCARGTARWPRLGACARSGRGTRASC